MAFFAKVIIFLSLAISLEARALQKCDTPIVRKEWRTLDIAEQKSYISAVKCVMEKPALTSQSDLPGARTRFDDYMGTHILQTPSIHFVGVFYPWHRLFVAEYEKELQSCGYDGAQPYWDWTLDADSEEAFFNSPLFDPETGFGGNGEWIEGNSSSGLFAGRTGGGCVGDGPFNDTVINLGPDDQVDYNPRCLRRDFTPAHFTSRGNRHNVSEAMALPDYGTFDLVTESSIHVSAHLGVGGQYGLMTDVHASPGDPLFYLHHANLDRAWWSWQSRDPARRLMEISGPLVLFDYNNTQAGNATLDTLIHVGSTHNITAEVRDVMDIEASYLCYTYDRLY